MIPCIDSEMTFESLDIMLPTRVRLRIQQGGAADGPAVLLLHGLIDSSFSFSRVMPLLPPHLRVVVPDQRGHGDSDRPDTGYTVDDFALDALQLLDHLGIARAMVVGHSMGSFVARRMAERAPARVTQLVLTGGAVTARNRAVTELQAAVASLTDPVDEAFLREFQESTISRPVPPEFLARVVAESSKVPLRVFRSALDGLAAFQPQWPITCLARIIGGEQDAVFSRDEQVELFRNIDDATLHLEPGIGHALHWEDPERFVALAFAGV